MYVYVWSGGKEREKDLKIGRILNFYKVLQILKQSKNLTFKFHYTRRMLRVDVLSSPYWAQFGNRRGEDAYIHFLPLTLHADETKGFCAILISTWTIFSPSLSSSVSSFSLH